MRLPVMHLAFASVLLFPAGAAAQTPAATAAPHKEVRGQLGASINNAGLQNTLDLTWTWPLSTSSHPLLSDAHITAGLSNGLTPAQARLGGWVEIAPLSIVAVRTGFDPAAYFGTFNSLQSFDAYDEPFDKDARDARGGARAGTGSRFYVSPSVRMKAGRIVALASADFEWWRSSAAGPLFYEPTRDTLLKASGDRLMTTTTVLMYQRGLRSGTMSAGAIHNLTDVFDASENRIQKLGMIVVRNLDGRRMFLPNPRLTLVVARYIDDPSKEGQWTAAIAVGFRK